MTKQLSNHAAAAKQIRAELKKHNINAVVRADGKGTSSVDVYLVDALPATVEQVRAFARQYQYGHFDGMQDLYEYSNRRDDLPQVRFVTVHNRHSDEVRQAAWDYLRAEFAGFEDAPAEQYKAAGFNHASWGAFGDVLLWRVLTGQLGHFWRQIKPRVAA
jgi:hypothetical protein